MSQTHWHHGWTAATCSHRWYRLDGCQLCALDHDVAPMIQTGNHRAMQPGSTYACRCGARITIAAEERSWTSPRPA